MSYADLKNTACLCAWIDQVGQGTKEQLKAFIEATKGIITVYKAQWLLFNTDYEDILNKEAAEAALALFTTLTDPLRIPASYLENYARAFSDCPPVASLSQAIKALSDELLGDFDTVEFKLQQYINSIKINQGKAAYFDMLIGICDDVIDAIDLCGA